MNECTLEKVTRFGKNNAVEFKIKIVKNFSSTFGFKAISN
jgi:hypothetical protein